MNKIDLKKYARYKDDVALWATEQAALIRAGKLDLVDLENVAEEIESLNRSIRSEIRSRLKVLLVHLLKYRFQPSMRTPSWRSTITLQRLELEETLDESPSLRRYPAEILARSYQAARYGAAGETRLGVSTFPPVCPFSAEDVFNHEFYPAAAKAVSATRPGKRKARVRSRD